MATTAQQLYRMLPSERDKILKKHSQNSYTNGKIKNWTFEDGSTLTRIRVGKGKYIYSHNWYDEPIEYVVRITK